MSACEGKELLLQGLLDGELDAANTLACEAHLRQCRQCAAEFERLQALRGRLRVAGVAFEAPPELRARVMESLRASEVPVREAASQTPAKPAVTAARLQAKAFLPASRSARKLLIPWLLGGLTTALAVAVAFVLLVRLPASGVADELVAGHVRSLLATHLVDVAASDRHVVKPWFAGKVAFAPPVPELADQGFSLLGGRLDYVHGRVVAALVYRRRQHVINLFVWPATANEPPPVTARRAGYNVVGWEAAGLEFHAVSDIDAGELRQLQAAFVQATN